MATEHVHARASLHRYRLVPGPHAHPAGLARSEPLTSLVQGRRARPRAAPDRGLATPQTRRTQDAWSFRELVAYADVRSSRTNEILQLRCCTGGLAARANQVSRET